MLQLINIKKTYVVGDQEVPALKGINLRFRKNEFVSILGASGCGKTTLLNIIGGLDQYTSGDLVIEGVSTKKFNDRDWDTYRNHSVGFIFQSYHLIPHQTILQNVELALTISGISKGERRRRAIEALDKVGLKDKINNRPNQLSGGQAQRVAIARALINDPEIVLADEPTGALDSKTSVQIMELLKEISKDRLVIMVTHNPELAEKYSTRIIRLLDGKVTGDTMPFHGLPEGQKAKKKGKKTNKGKKKAAMSLGTTFGLSLKNLLSKHKRTTMVSVAGSIGIIGVSMVLAISAGVQNYITDMENDMLSGYPVTITESAMDYNALMEMQNMNTKVDITRLDDKIYVDSLLKTLGTFSSSFSTKNTITENYLSYLNAMPKEYYNVLQYGYGFTLANNIYTDFKVTKDSPLDGSEDASGNMSVTAIRAMYTSILAEQEEYKQWASTISTISTFSEIPDNFDYILSQYDIVASYIKDGEEYKTELSEEELKNVFEEKDSLIMVVNDRKTSDLLMGQYGYFTQEEFLNYAYSAVDNEAYDEDIGLVGGLVEGGEGLGYDFFVGENAKTFTYYTNDSVYTKLPVSISTGTNNGFSTDEMMVDFTYNAYSTGGTFGSGSLTLPLPAFTEDGLDLKVKIILQKKKDISYGCLSSGFYYTNELTKYVLENEKNSKIVQFIEENGNLDILPYVFKYSNVTDDGVETKTGANAIMNSSGSSLMGMLMSGLGSGIDYSVTAAMLGGSNMPLSVYIYPLDFDSKDLITDYLDAWNDMCENGGTYGEANVVLQESDKINYTDSVGMIITMVNTMIQIITIALICFTALSLIVSTVMIGIITYVSVVERVKEIGILRAMGARKKDIKRLFNAETFIIGFMAGVFGILVTYLLSLIVNLIVGALSGIFTIAALPWWQALIMIGISVVLTLISGLIPASSAAKKDPVIALRTE